MYKSIRIKFWLEITAVLFVTICIFLYSIRLVNSASLLSEDFAGTTIDTNIWTEIDTAGAGGSSGNIQQNGNLSTANGFVGGVWGANALVSAESFDSQDLEISAVMTRGSDQLLGYGDYNFQSAGTRAYIIDLSSAVLALTWENGSLRANANCGAVTSPATYMLKVIPTGFEVYKNGALICTQTPGGSYLVDDKPIFLQAASTASTFDDVLVVNLPNLLHHKVSWLYQEIPK